MDTPYRFLFISILFGTMICFDSFTPLKNSIHTADEFSTKLPDSNLRWYRLGYHNQDIIDTKTTEFDSDFAEDMSRQLPEWYIENQLLQEQEIKEFILQEENIITPLHISNVSDEEEKKSGFYLPGLFEVFPELKLKWPIWSKNNSGDMMNCEVDEDCQFPQACCQHPFLLGDKFCCTGLGQRVMVPAYQGQEVLEKGHSK